MPETRVRIHLPVTVRVRGTPAPGQLDEATAAAALAVRRAVAQARARARRAGWILVPGPGTRVAVRVPSAEAADPDAVLQQAVDGAVRAGVRLGASQALLDLGIHPSPSDVRQVPGEPPPPDAEDPPTLAVFATLEEVQAVAWQLNPLPGALLPRGQLHTGVYGVWKATMTPTLFWVVGEVTAGLERGGLIWDSMRLVMGSFRDGRWVARGAGNEPAALQPGSRYRLDARIPGRPARPRSGRPAPRAFLEAEGGAQRRPLHLDDSAYERLRNQVIRFAVPFGTPTNYPEPPPPPRPLTVGDRRRRAFAWELLFHNAMLPVEAQGEPEALWEWFGYLNLRPEAFRKNPVTRAAIDYLAARHGQDAITRMNLLFDWGGNDLIGWRRRFLIAFCLQLALRLLADSRQQMKEFLHVIDQPEWRGRFADFLRALIGWSAPVSRYLRLQRKVRYYAQLEQYLRDDPECTDEGFKDALDTLAPDREEVRREFSSLPPPTEETEMLTASAAYQPILLVLTVHDGWSDRSLVEDIADAVLQNAPLTPDQLADVFKADLNKLIEKTVTAEDRLRGMPEDAYQIKVVQDEARQQLEPWFAVDQQAREQFEDLVSTNLVAWLGLGLGMLLLAFLFPPLAGVIAVAGFGISTYSAASSVARAIRYGTLAEARLAQKGFTPLVSQEELSAAELAAAVDIFFAVLDIGPSARAVAGGTRAVARHAAGALGLQLEEALLQARRLDSWPHALRDTVFDRLLAAVRRQRPGLAEAEAAQLAGELFEPAQLEMVARYEENMARVRTQLAERLETPQHATTVNELRDWLRQQNLGPDEFLQRLAEDSQYLDGVVARQPAAGQALAARPRVAFLGTAEELAGLAERLGELAKLLTPERVFAFREATGLAHLGYRELSEQLATILRRVDAPEPVLEILERVLTKRLEADAVLGALGNVPNPRTVIEALTPELLDAAGHHGGAAELVRALHEPTGAGETLGRVFSDLDPQRTRQLFREVQAADGTHYLQRWDRTRAMWQYSDLLPPLPEVAPRVVQPVTDEARAAARQRLEAMTAERTPIGQRPTAAAQRIQASRALAEASDAGKQFLDELITAAARENPALAGRILANLQYLEGGPATEAELAAMAGYLRRSGQARELAAVLARGQRQPYLRGWIRRFLEQLPNLREGDLRGLSLVFQLRGYGQRGAETVMHISRNFGPDARYVFGALDDLAPHSEGLNQVISDLASSLETKNQGALGQLYAGQKLLRDNPGVRLRFEVPDINRVVDIEVVTKYTGVVLRQVESKDITRLFPLTRNRTIGQLALDIVRSTKATAGTNERPLSRILWMIRRQELEESVTRSLLDDAFRNEVASRVSKAATDVTFKDVVRAEMSRAFEHPATAELGNALTAARRDFDENFDKVVQFF